MFGRNRPDGTRVTDVPRLRHFIPFLLPRRNEAVVYFEQRLDLGETLDYIARWNEGGTRPTLTLFHVLMAALARTLHERPRMNRFIAGRRLWQRNAVELSMSVIKAHNDDARLTVVKQAFPAGLGLGATLALVEEAIGNGRAPHETASEKEVAVVSRLPRWIVPLVVRGQRVLDHFNLLPAVLIRNDPLYASAMVSNLGSIGVDAAYHHLFEHGTVTTFLTIGRVSRAPVVDETGAVVVRPVVTLRISFDERISDGYYAARSLDLFMAYAQSPWRMETEGEDAPGAPR